MRTWWAFLIASRSARSWHRGWLKLSPGGQRPPRMSTPSTRPRSLPPRSKSDDVGLEWSAAGIPGARELDVSEHRDVWPDAKARHGSRREAFRASRPTGLLGFSKLGRRSGRAAREDSP